MEMDSLAIGLTVAVAQKCHPSESLNGDAWASFATSYGEHRVAVIDGAGHGVEAARAASAARDELLRHPNEPLDEVLRRCHATLKGSRGAVMTLASIDLASSKLTVAGVGNIETQVYTADAAQHLMTQRGMLGASVPRIRPVEVSLVGRWVLVLHSDGVRARFSLAEAMPLTYGSEGAQTLADLVLKEHGRRDDDATVLVATSGH
jgi:serine phosphatase RsbU (regulator of sigma subunit)